MIHNDGQHVRDFISFHYVIMTILDAIKNPNKWQGIFNVSSGIGVGVLDAFRMFGQRQEPDFAEDTNSELRAKISVLDNTKWMNQWRK